MLTHLGSFVVAALAGAVVLAGSCVDSRGAAAANSSRSSVTVSMLADRFNDADVMFAEQMIPHHQQAIEMAKMAASHAQNPRVKQLAAKIEAEQAPEMNTMTAWLHAWGKPVPTGMPGMMSPMPGMIGSPSPGMTGHSAPGMMSQQDMSRLMAAHGAQFDRMFLQMMIRHHQGAVQMAKTEQAQGLNPAAKRLARQIQSTQTAEITQMQQMLEA